MSAFGGKADMPRPRRRINLTRLMLWTAPTLRHQGAIGWLRRNAPLEGSRPWARLARSVSISRSRFFKFRSSDGPSADQGRCRCTCQQNRAHGLGHDGARRAVQGAEVAADGVAVIIRNWRGHNDVMQTRSFRGP